MCFYIYFSFTLYDSLFLFFPLLYNHFKPFLKFQPPIYFDPPPFIKFWMFVQPLIIGTPFIWHLRVVILDYLFMRQLISTQDNKPVLILDMISLHKHMPNADTNAALHFNPNLYKTIYIQYFLQAHFTSHLCAQAENTLMRPDGAHSYYSIELLQVKLENCFLTASTTLRCQINAPHSLIFLGLPVC